MWPSSRARTDLRARAGASSPPEIRIEIDLRQSAARNEAVMRQFASDTVTAATEWSAGHALRPKRVADEPSFA
jgi:hypothetical protein